MFPNRSLLIEEIPHLRRYARALTRDFEAADDLVQSCMERALRKFSLWQSSRRLRPWLFTIMHNLHIDDIRYHAKRNICVPLSEYNEPASQNIDQEDYLNRRQILAEIDCLPQNYRDVVVLVGLDELSYADAAKVLSIPIGTLMSRLHRGRAKLREKLGMVEPKPVMRIIK